jgi:uncharacterized MAPEG superfamily protein
MTMSTDLWMLVSTVLLYFAIMFLYSFGRFASAGGIAWAFGNRDGALEVVPWVARAVRAQQNLTENIGPFAVLVLVAHAARQADAHTALGATIFFCARVVHAGLYLAGVPYLRSFAWAAALGGEALILSRLL